MANSSDPECEVFHLILVSKLPVNIMSPKNWQNEEHSTSLLIVLNFSIVLSVYYDSWHDGNGTIVTMTGDDQLRS